MRHLITAGLPYINGIKHLGNLVGSMLPADIYARFLRQRGEDVLYICGTDEHGAPAELAANEAGETVASYCDRMHRIQSNIYERFGLSMDYFGRSSSCANHELTQQIFLELNANGYINRKQLKQYYSLRDRRFLPDRYIMGTCPKCGYESARGDQCENCTSLLDPSDLKNPRSVISGSNELEIRESEHLFLDLNRLQPIVQEWVERQKHWPDLTRQIANKWLQEGLHERCITRSLNWGVSVPLSGFQSLVFYVWFDAPIAYISITRDWAESKKTPDAWKHYWLSDSGVRYTQFIGKDNLPFHTLMFPAMLLGSRSSWKLPDQIKSFHWLDYYGSKFSTSLKRGVFTDTALELYPPDCWRYALMTMVPENDDSTFTWPLFANAINKDLAQTLGNFVNRVLQFTSQKLGPVVPSGGTLGPAEIDLRNRCEETLRDFTKSMQALEFRTAVKSMRTLWTYGNQYIDQRAPWKTIKSDPVTTAVTMRTALNLVGLFATVSSPILPSISERLLAAFGVAPSQAGLPEDYLTFDRISPGTAFQALPPIITQIEQETITVLEGRFGSSTSGNPAVQRI